MEVEDHQTARSESIERERNEDYGETRKELHQQNRSPKSPVGRSSRSPRSRSHSRGRRSMSPPSPRERRRRGGSRDRSFSNEDQHHQRRRSGGDGFNRDGGHPRKPETENPEPSKVLGVFGLSLRTRERDLEDLFSKYGQVEKVIIIQDNYTKKSRGFGFITFTDIESAATARDAMNDAEIDERRIRVDFSITKKAHDPTPGQYMGRVSRRDRERAFRDSGRGYGSRRRHRSRSRGRNGGLVDDDRSRQHHRRHRSRSYSPRRHPSRSREYRRRRSPSFERRRRDSRSRSR